MVDHIRSCYCNREARDQVLAEYEQFTSQQIAKKIANQDRGLGKKSREEIDGLILTFIGQNALPFSIVGSSSFRRLLSALDSRYQMVSVGALAYRLAPERARKYSRELMDEIRAGKDFSNTLEFDGWTSNSGQSVLAIVVTRPTGKAALLDLVDISADPHTGEYISETAIKSIQTSGIELSKLNAIISHEASNCKLARRLLTEEDEFSHLIEYRCLSHVFNLIGASISKDPTIRRLLEKVLDLIAIISRNKPLAMAIVQAGGGKVVRPVPTRWYSTCSAINSVIKIKPVMLGLQNHDCYASNRWLPILEDARLWNGLSELKIYFDRLSSMIGSSEARDSSLANATRAMLEFGYFIFKGAHHNRMYINTVQAAFVNHFFRTDIDLLLAAYVMDPNLRVGWLTDVAIHRALRRVVEIVIQSREDVGSHDADAERSFSDALGSEFARYVAKAKRVSDPVCDVADFWSKSRDFLIIKQAGYRLALCRSSSANTERIFSALGRICVPSRNRLSIDLMFIGK